jgi:hypothetical protein
MRLLLAPFFLGKVLCGDLRGSFLERKLPLQKLRHICPLSRYRGSSPKGSDLKIAQVPSRCQQRMRVLLALFFLGKSFRGGGAGEEPFPKGFFPERVSP